MEARIGVLGGGFGGLYAVGTLVADLAPGVDITLFDKNNYLLYTPVLHEMSTGTVDARHLVIPIRKVIDPRKVHIRCEHVSSVNLDEKSFESESGISSFDYLIIAPGSETNFYCHAHLQENSLTFKTVEDALRLRNSIIDLLEKGAIEKDAAARRKLLTIAVAGGGCTGVELVAEIAQFINIILHRDYPEIKRSDVRILLIEAMDKILPSFPPYLSRIAMERLKRMGIDIYLKSPIQWVDKDFIGLKDGKVPKGILVWAAGVRARHVAMNPEQRRDPNNRVVVNERLEIPGYPHVYVIGDGALVINGKPLPPTASVAVQEGRYVARSILLDLQKKEVPPFRFHYRGDMASLGFMSGVSEIYGRHSKGSLAWILWKLVKLMLLPRYKNRVQILADWLITLAFKRDTSKFN